MHVCSLTRLYINSLFDCPISGALQQHSSVSVLFKDGCVRRSMRDYLNSDLLGLCIRGTTAAGRSEPIHQCIISQESLEPVNISYRSITP